MSTRCAVVIVVFLAACGGDSPTTPETPTTREGRWEQDLDSLARQLPELHVDAFARISRGQWEAEVEALRGAIPSLDDNGVVVGLMRLVALVGDSHTTLSHDRWRGFQQLPIAVDWFDDGVHVVAAAESYEDLLGARLRRIGGVSTEAAIEALRELVPHENEPWFRFSVVRLLVVPEILEAQSIVANAAAVTLELLRRDGEIVEREVERVPRGTTLTELRSDPLPLYRRNPEDNYWLSFLQESQTLYIQYRRASDMPSETVASFANRALGLIDANPVRAIVIDLRSNQGGNSSLLGPLIEGLEARPRWSSGEGLYTILGRATFSSAIINAIELRDRTRARLVGEPTGGKPNHFGEVRSFTLFNSGLTVSYSTRFFRLIDGVDPPSLEPEIRVSLSSQDFISGRDPVLETILGSVGP